MTSNLQACAPQTSAPQSFAAVLACMPRAPVPRANRAACQRVRETTCQIYTQIVDQDAVRRNRRHAMLHIRQIALYVSHVALSLPMWQVAIYFGRDQSTASLTCQQVEDRRDDAGFDAFVRMVEEAVKPLLETIEVEPHA